MFIFLFANPYKQETIGAAQTIAELLQRRGVRVMMEGWLHALIGLGESCALDEAEGIDIIISLGGDGTLLRTVQASARMEIPMLGINMGHVGFLLETNASDLKMILDRLLEQHYSIEERMLLEATINQEPMRYVMNDIALMRGQYPSSIEAMAYSNDELIFRVNGDGILVSTPTGTTGYSISAGGPVICPDIECVAVIPVCSHVLYQRPVVISAHHTIKLKMSVFHGKVHQAIIDGQIVIPITQNTEITIKKSSKRAKFIRFEQQMFLTRLREKQAEWSVK